MSARPSSLPRKPCLLIFLDLDNILFMAHLCLSSALASSQARGTGSSPIASQTSIHPCSGPARVRPNGLCGLPALQRVQGRNHRGHITRHCQRQSHAAPLPSTQHPHGSLLSRQRPGRRLSRLSTARAIQSVCPQASHPSKGCASSNTTARPHSLHEPLIALRQKPWPKNGRADKRPNATPSPAGSTGGVKYAVLKPWGSPTS
jgi:hypothetical protein